MNNISKAIVVTAIVALLAVSLISASPSSDGTTYDKSPTTSDELVSAITDSNYTDKDTVNITLNSGTTYTISQNLVFKGKNLNITSSDSTNPATIQLQSSGTVNTVSLSVDYSIYSGSSLNVSYVKFGSADANKSASLQQSYFWDVTFDHCVFDNTITPRILGGNDESTGGRTTIIWCQFNGPGKDGKNTLNPGTFAVTTISGSLDFGNNTIEGYDRGLNATVNQNDDGRQLMVYRNGFSDMGVTNYAKPTAFQFAGDVRDMEIHFTGNTVVSSTYGISVHNTAVANDNTRLIVSTNTFTNVDYEVLYSGGSGELYEPVSVIGFLNFENDEDFLDLIYTMEDPDQYSSDVVVEEYGASSLGWFIESDQNSEFTLDSVDDLLTFSLMVNAGIPFKGTVVQLGADIDLSDTRWIPIGNSVYPFTGTFTGNDGTAVHKITGLNLIRTNAQGDVDLGLFGYVVGSANERFTSVKDVYDGGYSETAISQSDYDTVIRDLILEDVNISTAGSHVGALAGYVENAYIAGIQIGSGTVAGATSVGGIVGIGYSVVMKDCTTGTGLEVGTQNEAKSYNIGGIAGCIRGNTGHPSLVTGCVNNSAVSGSIYQGGMGGIIGHVNGSVPVIVYGCKNNGAITVTATEYASTPFKITVGGIVGFFQGQYEKDQDKNMIPGTGNIIAECVNNGIISTTSDSKTAASLSGIVGEYYQGLVINSQNYADVNGNAMFVGGIVGHGSVDPKLIVDGCDNSGELTNTSSYGHVSQIVAAGTVMDLDPDKRGILYRNMVFEDTDALRAAMPQTAMVSGSLTYSAVSFSMENVVVKTPGAITVPERVFGFSADTQVATEITMNAPSGYKASVAMIYLDGAKVTLSGEYGTVLISGDNIDLTNSGTIDTLRIDSGDGIVIRNNGTMDEVTDRYFNGYSSMIQTEYSGCASVTIFNGTETNTDAKMTNVTSLYLNTQLYNHGTIQSDEYLLTVGVECKGTPVQQNNTFIVHNHGSMIGSRTTGDYNNMFFVPAAKEFTLINYENSLLDNRGDRDSSGKTDYWFIYYGNDGYSGDESSSVSNGTMRFVLAEDTVKKNQIAYPSSGTFDVNVLKSLTVGQNDKNATFVVKNISADAGSVTFSDGFGQTEEILLVDGEPVSLPDFTKPGLVMIPWSITEYVSGQTYVAEWNITEVSPKASVDITNPTIGQTVSLTANITEYEYLEYTYTWTIGNSTLSGKTVSYTIESATTEYTLSVLVKQKAEYTAITGNPINSSDDFTLTASEIPTYEVTFNVNVSDYDVTVKDSNGNTIEPVDNEYKLPNGDYIAVFTKAGYQDETVKFTVQSSDKTVSVDMKPVDTPDPEPEPDPDDPEPDTPEINPPSGDNDESLPPVIRPGGSSSSSDNNTVTIVACAAAAAVAAIMAVFLIVLYKKD